jgi:hypothetical protein
VIRKSGVCTLARFRNTPHDRTGSGGSIKMPFTDLSSQKMRAIFELTFVIRKSGVCTLGTSRVRNTPNQPDIARVFCIDILVIHTFSAGRRSQNRSRLLSHIFSIPVMCSPPFPDSVLPVMTLECPIGCPCRHRLKKWHVVHLIVWIQVILGHFQTFASRLRTVQITMTPATK